MYSKEKRTQFRLPYREKIIFSTFEITKTFFAVNISHGGMFIQTLEPFPIDTIGFLLFLLPQAPEVISVRTKVAHIIFDQQRAEIECGMGLQFLDFSNEEKGLLYQHLQSEKETYLKLQQFLNAGDLVDWLRLEPYLEKIPSLAKLDPIELNYRVNRVCSLFVPSQRQSHFA